MSIISNERGELSYESNELINDSLLDDPPAYRLGSPGPGGSLGKFSGDRLNGDSRTEVVLLQFKEDERFPGAKAGEVTLNLKKPNVEGDAAMITVLTIRHDGAEFHVPVNIINGGGNGPSNPPTEGSGNDGASLTSADGKYTAYRQGDGNFVVYDNAASKAVWSAWTGPCVDPNPVPASRRFPSSR